MLYAREVLKISSLYQSTSFHAASFLLSDAATEYQFKLHTSLLNPENENKIVVCPAMTVLRLPEGAGF